MPRKMRLIACEAILCALIAGLKMLKVSPYSPAKFFSLLLVAEVSVSSTNRFLFSAMVF
jgi:hypothetical protein